MAFKFLKHKWQQNLLVCFSIFVVVTLVLGFFVNRYWSPILANKVRSAVLTGTDSLYKVDFSDAELHVLQGKIVIYDINLKPDTAIYNRLKKQHLAPNNLVTLHVKRLVLSHIHPFKLYFQHTLDIGKVILSAPELHISYQLNHRKDTVIKDNRSAWQKVSKTLRSIHVGEILLNDVKFRYDDYSGNKVSISELKEMNLHADDLLIDSATQTDRSRLLYCKNIIAELKNYSGKTTDGLYSYSIKSLKLSAFNAQLTATGLTLASVNAATFFDKSKKDRYSLHLDSVQLNNFDFLTYHKYRRLNASSLIFSHGELSIFTNPNKVKSSKNKIGGFPNIAIYQLYIDMKIDTVLARSINIDYTEHNKKSNKNGTIIFNNTEGRFLNVTTNKEALQKNNISTAQVSSLFMNQGRLNASFSFNLTDKDAPYSYKGSLGPMKLQKVNPAIIPLAMIKFTSGTLKEVDFDIKANSSVSKGKVTVLYNDLKVTILKADTVNEKLKRMTIASLFANVFIIKHNNPDKEGEVPRSFDVVYTRPVNATFFNTLWKTLLTGIKPAVGYDEKTQQVTKARMAQSVINKQNRKIKKVLRKQKRAERQLKKQLKNEQRAEQNNSGNN
jgi:hypothetical protein